MSETSVTPSPAQAPVGTQLQLRPESPRQRKRPRLAEFSYKGPYAYHVTIVTHARVPVFANPQEADSIVRHLIQTAEQQFSLHAYCLMPDHLHILLQGTAENSNLLQFVQRLKQLTGFGFKQRTGQTLWQQSFYDHALRKDEDLAQVAPYIFANPVEADLVTDGGLYPWSGGDYYPREPAADGAKAASLRASISSSEAYHDQPP
ncbi:MAG: hypothetical protein GEU75_10170 [Dehalococcoidia bacterium]|nr:hypothetical protein [Dehalococcoidia bacterium]